MRARRLASSAVLVALLLLPALGHALEPVDLGPVSAADRADAWQTGHGYLDIASTPCLTPQEREAIQADLAAQRARLTVSGLLPAPDRSRQVVLGWPLRAADHVHDPGYHGVSGYVDHDPAYPDQLLDWNCGDRSYDLDTGYNHQGTDYFTWPFGWLKMDGDDVEIVAAADGVIIQKYDGYPDRNCGFGGGNWNAVYVQHADGSVAWYGHMKRNSTTSKPIGATVAQGEYLGIVGSSGNSTGPHLHLELYDADWQLIDPYDGDCHALAGGSWWADQRPYDDSALNALRTHAAPPDWQPCPTPTVTNEQIAFAPGELVYFASYYRDQLRDQPSQHEISRPDGTIWRTWSSALTGADHYAASWWYWSWALPAAADPGYWTYRVSYEGQTVEHRFYVGTGTDVPAPAVAGISFAAPRPNPFNPTTEFVFTVDRDSACELAVFDARGRLVRTLWQTPVAAGEHRVVWDGRDAQGRGVGSGMYHARLRAGDAVRWARATLVK